MNVFAISEDPTVAAREACNKHVVKMPLESAQLLCLVYHEITNIEPPYKKTHANHPCAKWARYSLPNFTWLYNHFTAQLEEYTRRYGRIHSSSKVLDFIHEVGFPAEEGFESKQWTLWPECMPEDCKRYPHPMLNYRYYYWKEKAYFAEWRNAEIPIWYCQDYFDTLDEHFTWKAA